MGDYSKLIVSCTVKSEIKKELTKRLEDFKLYASAYQSQERIVSIEESEWGNLNLILIGQRKWGDGIEDFCNWLKPYVLQGSGENEVFAMEFSEYSTSPKLYTIRDQIGWKCERPHMDMDNEEGK